MVRPSLRTRFVGARLTAAELDAGNKMKVIDSLFRHNCGKFLRPRHKGRAASGRCQFAERMVGITGS